jgi:hypothetical protein
MHNLQALNKHAVVELLTACVSAERLTSASASPHTKPKGSPASAPASPTHAGGSGSGKRGDKGRNVGKAIGGGSRGGSSSSGGGGVVSAPLVVLLLQVRFVREEDSVRMCGIV